MHSHPSTFLPEQKRFPPLIQRTLLLAFASGLPTPQVPQSVSTFYLLPFDIQTYSIDSSSSSSLFLFYWLSLTKQLFLGLCLPLPTSSQLATSPHCLLLLSHLQVTSCLTHLMEFLSKMTRDLAVSSISFLVTFLTTDPFLPSLSLPSSASVLSLLLVPQALIPGRFPPTNWLSFPNHWSYSELSPKHQNYISNS